ncbi:MAG: hypothetical protein HY898_31075 [Deltaproteobacteria bacterium]|nr:hypothetical protein [Deltaproteobacteria bacterium]
MRTGSHSRSRGTTIIEVMMALAMMAIGASGIIAMQKLTIVSNRDAKNLEVASEIARTWIERLRGDAMLWNHPSPLLATSDLETDTVWLAGHVQVPGTADWFRPTNQSANIYGVHDALGRDDPTAMASANGPFCVNVRLTWIRPNVSIRAEVRVYWLRQGIANWSVPSVPASPLCGSDPAAPPQIQYETQTYHFVHLITEIRQNTAM